MRKIFFACTLLFCAFSVFGQDLPEYVYEDKGKFVGLSILEWEKGLPYNLKNSHPCANIAVYVQDGKNTIMDFGKSFTVVADYEGDDWIFMDCIIFECGDKKVLVRGNSRRKVIDNGVYENLHCGTTKNDISTLAEMCTSSSTVTVYFAGEWSTPKYKLSKKQKRDIAALAKFYETLK